MKDVVTLEEAVWVDPDRMSGAPCFRGSRLPVQQLFDWLADGVPLLEPNNPQFTPIELTTEDEGSVAVVAE